MRDEFSLWLEFEEWSDRTGRDTEFFNMNISLRDGRHYALNVWLIDALERVVREAASEHGGRYVLGPDLIVAHADRAFLVDVVRDLIANAALKEEWLTVDVPIAVPEL